jgi:hypothetical protein
MKNIRKFLILIPVLLFVLACQAVMRPLEQVQDVGATAASIATQAEEFATQALELATEMAPIETLIPSAIPGLPDGNPLDPQSPPLKEWKGVPIMPQASAGEESSDMYIYKVAVTLKEVEEYYAAQLPSLGWKSEFSIPGTSGMAILMYSKDSQVLSITITDQQDFLLVMVTVQ